MSTMRPKSAADPNENRGDDKADSPIAFGVERIMSLIPHRYPMLLLDRVVNLIPHHRIHAVKGVTMNESFFQGHFPGHPIMPGVVIIEAMAQAATTLVSYSLGDKGSKMLAYFMSIDAAKFRKPVLPGSLIDLHVDIVQDRGKICRFEGLASVDGIVATEARFTAMVTNPLEK